MAGIQFYTIFVSFIVTLGDYIRGFIGTELSYFDPFNGV